MQGVRLDDIHCEAELRGEIANTVKFVQCTSEIAIAVKFAAGELGDASNYRISLSVGVRCLPR